MSKLTITEALAEVKTIDKRIHKKREFIGSYLIRQAALKDPLEKDGGTHKAIAEAVQSVDDLNERKIGIRRSISMANAMTDITVCGHTRPIADWLTWKREVAPGMQMYFNSVRNGIENVRKEAVRKEAVVVGADADAKPGDIIVHLNEKELAENIEELEEILGTLDGQLSLTNATTTVEL
jgi:hypothetical protein